METVAWYDVHACVCGDWIYGLRSCSSPSTGSCFGVLAAGEPGGGGICGVVSRADAPPVESWKRGEGGRAAGVQAAGGWGCAAHSGL